MQVFGSYACAPVSQAPVVERCRQTTAVSSRHVVVASWLLRALPLVLLFASTPCSGFSSCPAGRNNATYPTCAGCPAGTYSNDISCADCSAGSYSGINATACTPCAPGTFAGVSRSFTCASCSPGWYSGSGATSCTACPAGTYGSSSGGVASCTNCSGGTYSTTVGATSSTTCVLCGAGQRSAAGSSSPTRCTACPAGTYGSSSGGVASCTNCAGGTYSTATGATSSTVCLPCGSGMYSNAGSPKETNCTLCAAGTYGSTTGVAMCTSCPGGTYSPAVGATNNSTCLDCGPGRTSISGSSSVANCTLCDAGTYGSDTRGVVTCTSCLGGTYSLALGATNNSTCLDCGAGNHSNAGSSTCTGCPAGTYGSTVGVLTCTFCLAGTYNPLTSATNVTACLKCAPGTKSRARAAVCTSCSAGTYANLPGASACTDCAAGNYSTVVGASNASVCYNACPPGTYSNAGASSCVPCSKKFIAPNASSAFCSPCPYGSYRSNGTFCFYSPTASFSAPQSKTESLTQTFGSFSVATSRSGTHSVTTSVVLTHSNSVVETKTLVATRTNTSSWTATAESPSSSHSKSRKTRTGTRSHTSEFSESSTATRSDATITLRPSNSLAFNGTQTAQRSLTTTASPTITRELPPPPPILSAAAQVSSNIAVLASTAFGGDPVSVTQTAFVTIISCSVLRPVPSKLTSLTISLFYDAGPVAVAVGNVGLAVGFTIVHAVWTYAAALWRQCPFLEAASGSFIRFPSHSIRAAALLLPGSVYGSVSLVSGRQPSAADWVVSTFMIGVLVMLFSVRQWALWKHLLPRCSWCSFIDSNDPKSGPSAAAAMWIERRLLFPSGRWIPADLRNRFGALFSSSSKSRVHLFVVEQLLGLAAAACAAASLTSDVTLCRAAVRAMSGFYFCTALWIAVARPYRLPVNWCFLPLVYVVFGVACLLQSFADSSSYASAAAVLQSLASCLQLPRMGLVLWVDYRESRCFPEVQPAPRDPLTPTIGSSLASETVSVGGFALDQADTPPIAATSLLQPAESDIELEILSGDVSSSNGCDDLPLRAGAVHRVDSMERRPPTPPTELDENFIVNPLLQLNKCA